MDRSIVIVSGYFNPLHVGHVSMIEDALRYGERLMVIVNNDVQQREKKGRIIIPMIDRCTVVRALAAVWCVEESIDVDASVSQTLRMIRGDYPDNQLTFANGGDRSDPQSVAEYDTCRELDIQLKFGVGGTDKQDSSSRINQELDRERQSTPS